jgi:hypothetical protein
MASDSAGDRSIPAGSPTPTLPSKTGWEESVKTQTNAAFASLRRNATLNFFVRIGLYAASLGAFAIALWYATRRGDDMVGALLDFEESEFHEDRLLAITIPLILLLLLAAVSLLAALLIQSRGIDDFESGLSGISRLRREADAGVSRTRDTAHVLEEFVVNARRAFRLQLWFARTLFLVSLSLFALAVTDAIIDGVDLGTIALGAGSLIGLLIGVATGAGTNVGLHLGDATQLQLVVANATRQVNVVEELLLKIIEVRRSDPEAARDSIKEGVEQIDGITNRAVEMIQLYAEPPNDPQEQNRQLRARERLLAGLKREGPKTGDGRKEATVGGEHGSQ